MKYQLVLQWSASSLDDYDEIILIEKLLIDRLPGDSEVDGHDTGSGEANIFILTDAPERDFTIVRDVFSAEGILYPERIAFREIGDNGYKVLWPAGSKVFTVS